MYTKLKRINWLFISVQILKKKIDLVGIFWSNPNLTSRWSPFFASNFQEKCPSSYQLGTGHVIYSLARWNINIKQFECHRRHSTTFNGRQPTWYTDPLPLKCNEMIEISRLVQCLKHHPIPWFTALCKLFQIDGEERHRLAAT